MTGTVLRKGIILSVVCLLLAACGGGGNSVQPIASIKTNAPAAPDPALIPPDTVITLTYNASMDTTSLVLGGDMAGESNVGVWSTTNTPNDTLTLSPASSWAVRTGRHLIIDAKDTAGRQARTVNLAYDIYQGALYYVSYITGNDGNTGMSPLTAFQNIHAAVNKVSPSATILVAGGTYLVSYGTTDTRVVLRQDISLYGGYKSDFSVRDPVTYPSVIRDITSTLVGSAANPNFAVIASDAAITNTTLADGFTIYGTLNVTTVTADYTTAIRVHNGAAPAFANNRIYGGKGSFESIGILAVDSAPTIYNNVINGGSGPTLAASSLTYGIYVSGASPAIINNLVFGGDNTISSSAYSLVNGAGVLRNNILSGGNGTSNSIAVSLGSSTMVTTNPNIDNNILFTRTGGGTTACLNESTSGGSSTPASFRNNDLFDCAVLYSDYENGCNGSSSCTSIAQVNGLAVASANVSVDPQFANIYGPDGVISSMEDNDWHFSAGSPVSVTAGGLNGIDQGWSFITDKDNVVRPASGNPWSIGAYEPN
jgi:hypothetical protein